MKNLLILSILIVTFSNYGQAQVLTKALSNIQSETSEKVKQMLKQNDSENEPVPPKVPESNNADFKPSPSENLKNIANEMGKTAEEKAMFLQVFTEVKKGFEVEAAKKGMENNIAAAMTFLMATAVMVYHQSPEPSDAATERLFQGLNEMFDEMPEMASASHKDKQFLYDLYLSYGGLILASYEEAKASGDKNSLDSVRVFASSTLLELFKINTNDLRFEGNILKFKNAQITNQTAQNNPSNQPATNYGNTKYTTKFDDGWVATAQNDYVQLQKNDVELRLFYPNKEWDDSRLNTVEPNDHFWDRTVAPQFNISNIQNWSGVQFPVIYFRQADAVDKQTGKRSFVTMKIVYVNNQGYANVIVTISPNRAVYEQQFPHPNKLDDMLNANRFAVTAENIVGTWSGGVGGGGVEYYNAYGYQGMSAISTTDEFIFNSNSSYQQTNNSASINNGGTRFAKIQYNGKFAVNGWALNANNHYNGATTKFTCQLVAVRGGFLLVITDTRIDKKYTLFKKS